MYNPSVPGNYSFAYKVAYVSGTAPYEAGGYAVQDTAFADPSGGSVVWSGLAHGAYSNINDSCTNSQISLGVEAPISGGGTASGIAVICPAGEDTTQPQVSPDGSQIAATVGPSGQTAVESIDVFPKMTGATGTAITPSGVDASEPDWSPDGSSIAFAGSNNTISTVPAGVGAPTLILSNATRPAWTPYTMPVPRTLTIERAGGGSGTVSSSPAGIDCGSTCTSAFMPGSIVTLTALPAAGSTFAGWSGGGCSATGACQVTLNSDATITATFTPTAHHPSPPPINPAPLPINRIALARSKVSARHGFTLKVTLGAAGQIDIKVYQRVRRHGRTVLELIGLVTEHGHKGANTFAIKLVHHHKLTPGSYQLTIDSVSGHNTSKAHELRLTVTH